MAAQGLDKDSPPDAAKAKQMLDHIHGRWWNVYIGGPYSGKHWTPAIVRDYAHRGIDCFMLTYVGQQYGGPQHYTGTLTRERGHVDGKDALECLRRFGYSGRVPVALDIEGDTFVARRSGTIDYARAWCDAVRAGGAIPGIYTNPSPLVALHQAGVDVEFVWVAKWITIHPRAVDPHVISDLPSSMWSRPGQRAWQYAGGAEGRTHCAVLGVDVDISVADLGCLAPAPGRVRGAVASAPQQALRRGDHGPGVVRLTHRLSTIRSPRTGKPYLDGPRKRFDATVQAALTAFQHDHRMTANGIYDAASARALLTVARRQKRGRAGGHRRHATGGAGRSGGGAAATTGTGAAARKARAAVTLPALVERFQQLDAAANHAWQQIEAYGERSRRLLARAEAERRAGLPGIAASLRGIEHQLEDLVGIERRELAAMEHTEAIVEQVAAHEGAASAAAESAAAATAAAAAAAPPAEHAAAAHPATASDGASPPPPPPAARLADLTTAELDARIDSLDATLDDLRRERIARYARAEKRLRLEAEGTTVAELLQRRSAAAARAATHANGRRPAGRRARPAGTRRRPPADAEDATSLQQSLNRFTHRFLANVAPLIVDGRKGTDTDKRIKTAKFYLGYPLDERTAAVTPEFIRRLRHPRSLRYSNAAALARAASRRRRQRRAARHQAHAPIEGTPKHIIDTIVLPIAAQCGIHRTPAQIRESNRTHPETTDNGSRSEHKGPPEHAWAADLSNSYRPTPQMDELAQRLARRFEIQWNGAGLRNAYGHGYRFQLIYRYEGHYNHVHIGVRVV
jgi:hypothetical protein